MYAHVFTAGQGEDWTRVDRFSGVDDLADAERRLLASTGVRLSYSQPFSSGEAQEMFGIEFERVRGACRYHDSRDPSVQYRIVLVNE